MYNLLCPRPAQLTNSRLSDLHYGVLGCEVYQAVVQGLGVFRASALPQVVDDVLDFTGSALALGKPALNDLKSGLATAPVLFAAEV